jgi:hypothetical protein
MLLYFDIYDSRSSLYKQIIQFLHNDEEECICGVMVDKKPCIEFGLSFISDIFDITGFYNRQLLLDLEIDNSFNEILKIYEMCIQYSDIITAKGIDEFHDHDLSNVCLKISNNNVDEVNAMLSNIADRNIRHIMLPLEVAEKIDIRNTYFPQALIYSNYDFENYHAKIDCPIIRISEYSRIWGIDE